MDYKKCVLHIVSTGKLSGAEKVVSDICTNLSEDFKPIIVCAGEELKRYYEEKGIETFIIDVSSLKIKEIKKLRKLIADKQIDIVHGHDVKPSIAAYLGAKKLKVPVISHLHGTYPWLKKFGVLKFIDKYFRKKYNFNIACSNMVKEYYLTYNKSLGEDKVGILSNAFNFNELRNIEIIDRNEFRRQYEIKEEDFVFGYIGRLIELKGLDLLIRSFNEISKTYENVKLVIVGDGEESDNLKNQVKEYGLENKVIFAGYRKDIYNFMNIMDCFVLSSIREGLPMVILEAIAMNKVVISTPVAGVKEIISNDEYGIVLEERNATNMIEAMERIYKNPDKADAMAEKALYKLEKEYGIDSYMNKLQYIYNNLNLGYCFYESLKENYEIVPCNLEKAQNIMFNILKEVHRICEKHDIKYFLTDGTLLGAVRHKGFIPWDDDLDIGMTREDYEKFKKIAPSELSKEFFMQTVDTDPNYDLYSIPLKIRHNHSILIETEEEDKKYHYGIYIDIFPFDKVPESKFKYKIQATLSKILAIMKMKISFKDGINAKSIFRSLLQLIGKCISYGRVKKILYSTLKWNKNSNSHKLYHGVELTWNYEFKEEEIFPLKKIKFGEEEFWAPNKPHEVLTKVYGSYMELPPEDKRQYHAQFMGIKKSKN